MAYRLSRTQFDSLDFGEDALEEDIEDSPPQIKHCTLGNDLLQILSSDRIASMAVHPKVGFIYSYIICSAYYACTIF